MILAGTLTILMLGAISSMAADAKKETRWYTGEVQHEGLPLHLRFPEKPDFESLARKFPKLLVIKHTLAKVKSSGVPEPDYNDSLGGFDDELVTAFERTASGVTVLVETFGGRRTYYVYVSASASIEHVKRRFASKYPQHQLDWNLRDDAKWSFIRRYSEQYKFYKDG